MLTVRAFAALRRGDGEAALRDVLAARDAAGSDPEQLADCWENVGGVAHATGRYQLAVDAFRTAMQYKPDSEGEPRGKTHSLPLVGRLPALACYGFGANVTANITLDCAAELRVLKRAAKQAAANPGAANRGLTLLASSLEEGNLAFSLGEHDAAVRLFTQAMAFAPHRAEVGAACRGRVLGTSDGGCFCSVSCRQMQRELNFPGLPSLAGAPSAQRCLPHPGFLAASGGRCHHGDAAGARQRRRPRPPGPCPV